MARTFLAIVGVAYITLALWCAFAPLQTSKSVGFNLIPGAGQSEYFTVYGGLQFALAIVFLIPLIRPEVTSATLMTCLVIHASLVLFRSISLTLYSGIPTMTYAFAAIEWIILLGSAFVRWRT